MSFPGNINTGTSLTNLMLQSGMTRDQISMLAATGFTSSASLANLLMKKRSFDQHLNMDFQSIQSFEDLASIVRAGTPNQTGGRLPNTQMKNMDWEFQGVGATGMGNMVNPDLLSCATRQPSTRAAAVSDGSINVNNQGDNSNLGNFSQNVTLQGNNLIQAGTNDFNSFLLALQKCQQQQVPPVNYENLLQGIGGSSLYQNNKGSIFSGQTQNGARSNSSNYPFAGASQGNPMMLALAQQQLLAQIGESSNTCFCFLEFIINSSVLQTQQVEVISKMHMQV